MKWVLAGKHKPNPRTTLPALGSDPFCQVYVKWQHVVVAARIPHYIRPASRGNVAYKRTALHKRRSRTGVRVPYSPKRAIA